MPEFNQVKNCKNTLYTNAERFTAICIDSDPMLCDKKYEVCTRNGSDNWAHSSHPEFEGALLSHLTKLRLSSMENTTKVVNKDRTATYLHIFFTFVGITTSHK